MGKEKALGLRKDIAFSLMVEVRKCRAEENRSDTGIDQIEVSKAT